MDHKKVASLVPVDEFGDPFILDAWGYPVLFHAEFNDAKFSGNVSGLEGTFSGVLTAEAVNAAGNITIAGHAVATTVVVFDPAGRWLTEDTVEVIGSGNFLVPAGEEGILYIAVQYEVYSYGAWDSEELNWPTWIMMHLDGVPMGERAIQIVPSPYEPVPAYSHRYEGGYEMPRPVGNGYFVPTRYRTAGSSSITTLAETFSETGVVMPFGYYFYGTALNRMTHNASQKIGEGLHTFELKAYWPEKATNVHPAYKNVFIRFDYIRKF